MIKQPLEKSIWLVTLLRQFERLTLAAINQHWERSGLNETGGPMPRRSFINLREDVNRYFNITVACDRSSYEYYLEESEHDRRLTSMLLDTRALGDAINASRSVSELIFLEEIPSARDYLTLMVEALKGCHPVVMDYAPYFRATTSKAVVLHPYCMKLFRQRWYVTGLVPRDKTVKTYALDRITKATARDETFERPVDFSPADYYRDAYGIVVAPTPAQRVRLKVTDRQAKYLRGLPLHHSQRETLVDNGFSIFEYDIKISRDFVEELLSHGASIQVLDPPELRQLVIKELHSTLQCYETPTDTTSAP